MLRFSVIFIFLMLLVSPANMQVNLNAAGLAEKSSPEESRQVSLPNLGFFHKAALGSFLPASRSPVDLHFQKHDLKSSSSYFGSSPLLTSGIFPYQPDPFMAFVAASLTLAVQSMKEQGKVDFEAIRLLLDSTDYWAGVIGSGSAAIGRWVGKIGVQKFSNARLPNTYARLSKMKLLTNFINGVTYTLAVTGGYEYFSQFWKLATENVENVSRVSDLFKTAERKDIAAVRNNLFMYLLDPRMQKRIADSIYTHRIQTYEFIAMNLALYMGLVVGEGIAKKKTPAAWGPWKKRLARYFGAVVGGTTAGIFVQWVTPDAVRIRVNKFFLHHKIEEAQKDLNHHLDRFQEGIAYGLYPEGDYFGLLAEGGEQMDLHADLDRIRRDFDLLNSLYLQQIFTYEEAEEGFQGMQRNFETLDALFSQILGQLDTSEWSRPNYSGLKPSEMEELAEQDRKRPEKTEYYAKSLEVERDLLEDDRAQMNLFVDRLMEARAQKLDEASK